MSGLSAWQQNFARTLGAALEGDARADADSLDALALTPARRFAFDVHRVNVKASLGAVLKDVYPVCHALVDGDFFDYLARSYISLHPPAHPALLHYGAAFAGHLAQVREVGAVPYLADVARLEWAWHHAYHAADAPALDTVALAAVPPDLMSSLVFAPHPSLTLLASDFPVDAIWQAHQGGAPEETVHLPPRGAWLAVARSGNQVRLSLLEPAAHSLIQNLVAGAPLAQAIVETLRCWPDMAADHSLAQAITAGFFASCALSGNS